VTAGVTGGKVVLPEFTPNDVSGDRFVLHIAGTLDKEPFEITKQFNYDDLKLLELSKENRSTSHASAQLLPPPPRYTQQDNDETIADRNRATVTFSGCSREGRRWRKPGCPCARSEPRGSERSTALSSVNAPEGACSSATLGLRPS